MIVTSIIALILSGLKPNLFLFIVGIFTLYLVGTGQRYLKLKNLLKEEKPETIDWIYSGGMFVVGFIFIV